MKKLSEIFFGYVAPVLETPFTRIVQARERKTFQELSKLK